MFKRRGATRVSVSECYVYVHVHVHAGPGSRWMSPRQVRDYVYVLPVDLLAAAWDGVAAAMCSDAFPANVL